MSGISKEFALPKTNTIETWMLSEGISERFKYFTIYALSVRSFLNMRWGVPLDLPDKTKVDSPFSLIADTYLDLDKRELHFISMVRSSIKRARIGDGGNRIETISDLREVVYGRNLRDLRHVKDASLAFLKGMLASSDLIKSLKANNEQKEFKEKSYIIDQNTHKLVTVLRQSQGARAIQVASDEGLVFPDKTNISYILDVFFKNAPNLSNYEKTAITRMYKCVSRGSTGKINISLLKELSNLRLLHRGFGIGSVGVTFLYSLTLPI